VITPFLLAYRDILVL